MHYRTLGRTGLEVSEVGFGGWGIGGTGWIGAADDESLQALNAAIDLGINFIDTALGYGNGHSERLIGEVVRQRPETVYVSTKIPPANRLWPAPAHIPADAAYPADHVRRCTEESLANLGCEAIDVQQFHVWSDEWVGAGGWLEAIETLKREGKIRFFGVSINDHQPANALRLIDTGVLDTVQVIYNLFDQSPEDELLPACREHDVGVIVRVPFDEGGLTGRVTAESTFAENDFRSRYFRDGRAGQVHERALAIARELGVGEDALPEIALRYVLSEPTVSTVIPGMRSVRNVERNVGVADGQGLAPEQVERLHAHRWIRNFYE